MESPLDFSDQSIPSVVSVHSPVEDESRLKNLLLGKAGLLSLPGQEREKIVRELNAGLSQLATGGTDWIPHIKAISDSVLKAPQDTTKELHEIAHVVQCQPSIHRTGLQRLRCQALGAKALMAVLYGHIELPKSFANALSQLFTSNNKDWTRLSELEFLDPTVLQEWEQKPAGLKVVNEFVATLREFVTRPLPTPSPSWSADAPDAYKTAAAAKHIADLGGGHSEQPLRALAAATPKPQPKRRTPAVLPKKDLLQAALSRCFNPGSLDGYRLNGQWEHLHPDELRGFLLRLNEDLDAGSDHKRKLHACARHVSLIANLPLYLAWALPIASRPEGSMWLDIQQGGIGRDSRAIAPRADRPGRGQSPFKWLTPLPPVVATSLRIAYEEHQSCRSLGEFLERQGLTYRECCDLAIEGWKTSHIPADGRISASLAPALRELGIHPLIAALAAGDARGVPLSDFYYVSIPEEMPYDAIGSYCRWIGLRAPEPTNLTARICCGRSVSIDRARSALGRLASICLKSINSITPLSKPQQLADAHKTYTLSVITALVLAGVGGRGDRIHDARWGEIFASPDLMILADKNVDRYASRRVVPVTEVLKELRHRYVNHFSAVGKRLAKAGIACGAHLEAIARGELTDAPAFWLLEEKRERIIARPVRTKDLRAFVTDVLQLPHLNCFRHLYFAQLVGRNAPACAMESLLGHHIRDFEPHGYASGLSIREMCEFLSRELTELHEQLGLSAIVGLGQKAQRYQKLPHVQLPARLDPLDDKLLRARIASQDGNPRDRINITQDAAVTRPTLVVHTYCTWIRQRYLSSSLVGMYPAGALLFCLIAREAALARADQDSLLKASLDNGAWQIGAATVLEAALENGRPVVQRIVDTHTAAAVHGIRDTELTTRTVVDAAREQLHYLLKALDPRWPGQNTAASCDLMQTIAAHWCAVEVAPGALFIAKHKASFIPASQLARMHYKRACAQSPDADSSRTLTGGNSDLIVIADRVGMILQRAAEKDERTGGLHARRMAIREGLLSLKRSEALDEFSTLLVDLHLADHSAAAPFRQLAPATSVQYHPKYVTYFTACASEGTLALDAETMQSVFRQMGGGPSCLESSTPRSAMLHLAAFLDARGLPAMTGILASAGRKVNALPRVNVYVLPADTDGIANRLRQQFVRRGGTYALADRSLQIWRETGLRPSESRFASYADWDPHAKTFIVTESGHAHMKTRRSMGYIQLKGIHAAVMQSIWEARASKAPSRDIKLFAEHASVEDAFQAYDEVKAAIVQHGRTRTGCNFRLYDLRISAVTDRAFNLPELLPMLFGGEQLYVEVQSSRDLVKKLTRFASAGQLARHSTLLTTLRYYVVSGCVDLRSELDRAAKPESVAYAYAASVKKCAPHSLEQALQRQRKGVGGIVETGTELMALVKRAASTRCEALPVPLLGALLSDLDRMPEPAAHSLPSSQLYEAALLALTGRSSRRAATTKQVPDQDLARLLQNVKECAQSCGVQYSDWSDARAQLVPDSGAEASELQSRLVGELAHWVASNPTTSSAQLVLSTAITTGGASLHVRSQAQLDVLLPTLMSLGSLFNMRVQFGALASSDGIGRLAETLDSAQIERVPNNTSLPILAVFSFVGTRLRQRQSAALRPPSARSVGRYGKLAVYALLLSMTVSTSNYNAEHEHEETTA